MREAITTGIVGFAAYLLLALILLRVRGGIAASVVVTVTSIVAYVGVVAAAIVSGPGVWFWPLSATYWFLTLCFLMVFGAVYKSISFRMLHDLSQRRDLADRYDAILSRCVERESYQDRLRVMQAAGLAARESGNLRLTHKGRRLAAVVSWIQTLYKIERSG